MSVHARKVGVARDGMDDEEEEEAQAGTRSQKLLHLTRMDLGQIPARQAREILTQYDPLVRGFVRRFPRALLGPRFDADDLYSLSQALLLQFWLLYDPARDEGRGSFRGWASFLFRQVLAKIGRDLGTGLIEFSMSFDGELTTTRFPLGGMIEGRIDAWVIAHLSVEEDIEAQMDVGLEMRLLDRALEELPARQRFILQGIREGRSTAQIAADLAITRQRVDQIRIDAMTNLRRVIGELRGTDDEELEAEEPEDPAPGQRGRSPATLVA